MGASEPRAPGHCALAQGERVARSRLAIRNRRVRAARLGQALLPVLLLVLLAPLGVVGLRRRELLLPARFFFSAFALEALAGDRFAACGQVGGVDLWQAD